MRHILLRHSDYDSLIDEHWTIDEPGYLLTPHIVMFRDTEGLGFHCFEDAIGERQAAVSTVTSKIINLHVSGASVEGIDLAKLAVMTVAELGEILASQIN